MKITALLGPELLELCRRSIRCFVEHDMPTYAAALAYRALFALFPFFAFLAVLLGLLNVGDFFEWLIDQAHSALQANTRTRRSS